VDHALLDLLCCPVDQGAPLIAVSDSLTCPTCGTVFPIVDGIVVFLTAQELSDQEHQERAQRDDESSWYDAMFEGYTNAVEVPTAIRRVGRPFGPILDAGCGTGRVTEALTTLGQPIVAVDYSSACLRRMLARTAGHRVLAVQSDLRALPLRSDVMAGATCIEVYSQMRSPDRKRFAAELARVLAPGAPLSISAFNYNLMFRAWSLAGNKGSRTGEHMLGGDYYYWRFTRDEFRTELAAVLDVQEISGIRNIPARTLAEGMRKLRLARAGDRFLRWMVDRGHRIDFFLERTALAGPLGFFWQARAVKPPS
jgi:uncharacterized protein YbaR (Trm112 family)